MYTSYTQTHAHTYTKPTWIIYKNNKTDKQEREKRVLLILVVLIVTIMYMIIIRIFEPLSPIKLSNMKSRRIFFVLYTSKFLFFVQFSPFCVVPFCIRNISIYSDDQLSTIELKIRSVEYINRVATCQFRVVFCLYLIFCFWSEWNHLNILYYVNVEKTQNNN